MQFRRDSIRFISKLSDMVLIIICFIIALLLSKFNYNFPFRIYLLILFQIIIWLFSAYLIKLYEELRSRKFSFEFILIFKMVSIQAVTLIVLLFITKIVASRILVLYYVGTLLILSIVQKYFARRFLIKLRLKGRNLRSLLIIGAGKVGREFYDTIKKNPHFGYHLIGFLDDNPSPDINGKYIGPISALEILLNKVQIDYVIVTLPNYAFAKIEEI